MSEYVMVPREPTRAMQEAFFDANAKAVTVFAGVPELWAAMLAAAPTPPSGEAIARVPTGHPTSVVEWLGPMPVPGTLLYTAPQPAAAAPREPAPAAPRPTDDELWDQTLRERDSYHDVADQLAAHIARITSTDIGEHSSANCPWQNALEAAEDYDPSAPPVGKLQRDAERFRFLSSQHQGPWIDADDQEYSSLSESVDAAMRRAAIQARRQQGIDHVG